MSVRRPSAPSVRIDLGGCCEAGRVLVLLCHSRPASSHLVHGSRDPASAVVASIECCALLIWMLSALLAGFAPYVEAALKIIIPLIRYPYHEDVRIRSVLPVLSTRLVGFSLCSLYRHSAFVRSRSSIPAICPSGRCVRRAASLVSLLARLPAPSRHWLTLVLCLSRRFTRTRTHSAVNGMPHYLTSVSLACKKAGA